MNVSEMRTESQAILTRIDEHFLAAVYALLKTYDRPSQENPLGYTSSGEEVGIDQFIQEADNSVDAARAGKRISAEELEKRSQEWLERLK